MNRWQLACAMCNAHRRHKLWPADMSNMPSILRHFMGDDIVTFVSVCCPQWQKDDPYAEKSGIKQICFEPHRRSVKMVQELANFFTAFTQCGMSYRYLFCISLTEPRYLQAYYHHFDDLTVNWEEVTLHAQSRFLTLLHESGVECDLLDLTEFDNDFLAGCYRQGEELVRANYHLLNEYLIENYGRDFIWLDTQNELPGPIKIMAEELSVVAPELPVLRITPNAGNWHKKGKKVVNFFA